VESYSVFSKKSKTFKAKKDSEGTNQYRLKKYAEATLGSGNLKLAVQLPEGEDLNEWLAVNSACSVLFPPISALWWQLYLYVIFEVVIVIGFFAVVCGIFFSPFLSSSF
jgi:hypothetical protein